MSPEDHDPVREGRVTRSPSHRVTFVVDSREQQPYSFDPRLVQVVRAPLPAGDYSLLGFENRVSIERKSLPDLVATLFHARERFRRELLRMQQLQLGMVVVEANLEDVMLGRYPNAVHPNALLGAVVAVHVEYRVPVMFLASRQVAVRFVEALLLRFHRRAEASCPGTATSA
jgi:DNA excision repair protein ERCC-4